MAGILAERAAAVITAAAEGKLAKEHDRNAQQADHRVMKLPTER